MIGPGARCMTFWIDAGSAEVASVSRRRVPFGLEALDKRQQGRAVGVMEWCVSDEFVDWLGDGVPQLIDDGPIQVAAHGGRRGGVGRNPRRLPPCGLQKLDNWWVEHAALDHPVEVRTGSSEFLQVLRLLVAIGIHVPELSGCRVALVAEVSGAANQEPV